MSRYAGSFLTRLCVGMLLALVVIQAQATLQWSWDFDDYHPVVAPTDSVSLHATLYNDASSTEHITEASFYGRQAVLNPHLPYQASSTYADFMAQLAGLDLAPGEIFNFVFMVLSPVGGSAPVGEYGWVGDMSLAFVDQHGWPSGWFPDHDLHLTVAEHEPGGEVPEPASAMLVVIGLIGAGYCRTRVAR